MAISKPEVEITALFRSQISSHVDISLGHARTAPSISICGVSTKAEHSTPCHHFVANAKHSRAFSIKNNFAFRAVPECSNFPLYMLSWPSDRLLSPVVFYLLLLGFRFLLAFIANTLVLTYTHLTLLRSLTMGWKTGLLLLGLATIARPQGDIGGTQYPPCTPAQTYQYKGCFPDSTNGPHMNFHFQVIPNTTVNKNNYPNFGTTQIPTDCQNACRGHGFKWASLYNGTACYCGTVWPTPNTTYNFSTQTTPQYPIWDPNYVYLVNDSNCNV